VIGSGIADRFDVLDGLTASSETEEGVCTFRIANLMRSGSRKEFAMRLLWVVTAGFLGLVFSVASTGDEQEVKFSDCPAAVRKTFQNEAKGAVIATVMKETEEDHETIYWADVKIKGKMYAVGVLEDGTLTEMNLALDVEELPFDRCPAAVQAAFRHEAFGQKVSEVGKDIKYGVTIFEAVVVHRGKKYEIVVAEDGTLVEKVLVIEDEEVELAKCPAAVQTTLRAHAEGGTIGDITRATGIGQPTYEAEIKIKTKVYLLEIAESGLLISKSLEAGEE
jgi:hypothetical protein